MTRPKGSYYSELNFRPIIVNKNHSALCLFCHHTLRNTAESRLKTHRMLCHGPPECVNDGATKNKNNSPDEGDKDASITFTTPGISGSATKESDAHKIPTPVIPTSMIATLESDLDISGNYAVCKTQLLPITGQTSRSVRNNHRVEIESDDGEDNPDDPDYIPSFEEGRKINSSRFESFTSTSSDNSPRSLASSSNTSCDIGEALLVSSTPSTTANKYKNSGVKKGGHTPSMRNYIDVLTQKDIDNISEKLSHFFYGCNIPFVVVESKHFREFVKSLNSAYAAKLPSAVDRKKLSEKYLPLAYEKCQNVVSEFRNRDAVLLIDGWRNSSANSKNIVAILHNANGDRAFLEAWDYSTTAETANYLSEIVNKCVEIAKDRYGANIFVVVSDNASNMVAMGHIVDIWHSTCNSHTANLLAKNIATSFNNVIKQVTKVLKAFVDPGNEAEIVRLGGHKIYLPVDTRWSTYRDACLNYKKNLPLMRHLLYIGEHGKNIKGDLKLLILDDNLVSQVDELMEILDPVSKLINTCQTANVSVSTAAYMWMQLQAPIKFENLKDDFDLRHNMALNKYALSAFFLDPNYYENALKFVDVDNTELNMEEKTYYPIVQSFIIDNLTGDGITSFYAYLENRSYFKTLREKGIKDPLVFWKCASAEHRELSDLAYKLCLIPASTALLEGCFNQWSYIHNPKRNRLSFQTSKQLMFVYHSLKLRDIKTCDY